MFVNLLYQRKVKNEFKICSLVGFFLESKLFHCWVYCRGNLCFQCCSRWLCPWLGGCSSHCLSAFLETISNREEDSRYTLGYKRFSLLGALVTAVILMTGSGMVILENISKLFHPQPVNDEGLLWLGIIAISVNLLASLVIRKGQTKNESILSLHFWKIP